MSFNVISNRMKAYAVGVGMTAAIALGYLGTAGQYVGRTALPTAPPLAGGSYYMTPNSWSATTSNTLGNGTLRVSPVYIPSRITITKIGAEVSTVGEAGSKFRVGIYADNGSGMPGSLVLDAGQIAGDSATLQDLTVSVTLYPGTYWFGGAVQSAATTQPTMRVGTVGSYPLSPYPGGTMPANSSWFGVGISSVTGALPASFGTPTSAAGSVPRVHFLVGL